MKTNTHFETSLYRYLNIETKLVLTSENCIKRNVVFVVLDSFFYCFQAEKSWFLLKKNNKIFVPDTYYKEIIDKYFKYILSKNIYILKASKTLTLSKFTHFLEKTHLLTLEIILITSRCKIC